MAVRLDQLRTRILVVEDDPALGELYSLLIEEFLPRFSARVVTDGMDAQTVAMTEGPFVLVLCDTTLPRVDGATLVRALSTSPRMSRVPVVVATDAEEIAAIADLPTVRAWFRKPVDPLRIIEAMRRELERPKVRPVAA